MMLHNVFFRLKERRSQKIYLSWKEVIKIKKIIHLKTWPLEVPKNHIHYKFRFSCSIYLQKDNLHDILTYIGFPSVLHFDHHLWDLTPQNWPQDIPNVIIDCKFGFLGPIKRNLTWHILEFLSEDHFDYY